MAAVTWANSVAKDFEFDSDDVRRATKLFVEQMGRYFLQLGLGSQY